ncbi:ABC exporter membrane fusion protein [Microcoleus sp. FACHB-1515]|uniref:ABC exporter membrane fusion protein n=1 Tax=Cyanophyceae TaxID=3028117 RepID=UPI0016881AD9|nr:ABC exporter membrane fusion protein [Microcoleus sp. FACHB-1515]MBD2091235.1 ABC exporter membrane fusion protein [Microcoleus sp. FACHB-1515]
MVSSDIFSIAKQGHSQGIASCLNQLIQPHGITARVKRQGACLYILLESNRSLKPQATSTYLGKLFQALNIAELDALRIYKRRSGEHAIEWKQEVELAPSSAVPPASTPLPPNEADADDADAPAPETVTRIPSKGLNYWNTGFVAAAIAASIGSTLYGLSWLGVGKRQIGEIIAPVGLLDILEQPGIWNGGRAAAQSIAPPTATVDAPITALGRLEPVSEVIRVSAPLTLDGDRVAQLLVKQGDSVQPGQVIAVLDSSHRLQSALREAQEQVRVAQSRYEQVRAGAKTGEIAAQQATIARLQAELQGAVAAQTAQIAQRQAELDNATTEYDRFHALYLEGAIAASALDSKRLLVETTQAQLLEASAQQNRTVSTLEAQIREAEANLSRIQEVRPVDMRVAQMEIDRAIAAMQRTQADLDQSCIRAPIAGQIMKIHAWPGEKLGENGLLELGQTRSMAVVAEVYQTDIRSVRVGQRVAITSQAFPGTIAGTVSELGLEVSQQNVFSNQPGENLDRRVIEVKIRLDPQQSKQVAGLTNLQVQVAIER